MRVSGAQVGTIVYSPSKHHFPWYLEGNKIAIQPAINTAASYEMIKGGMRKRHENDPEIKEVLGRREAISLCTLGRCGK